MSEFLLGGTMRRFLSRTIVMCGVIASFANIGTAENLEKHRPSRTSVRHFKVEKVEIINCGESLEDDPTGSIEAPGSHTGAVFEIDANATPKFKPGCPHINAALGGSFGVSVLVSGSPKLAVVDFTTRVTHPKFKDGTSIDEWESPMNIGIPRYAGWLFESDEERVPGKWTLEIVYEGKVVASQVFEVTRE